MRTDIELLDAWAGGDTTAGGELFERHLEALVRFFDYKVPAEVDDLIQQTLMECVRGRQRFRGEGTFRAYLFGIARHVLYEHWRNTAKVPAIDFTVSSIADLSPSPVTSLVRRRERRLMLEALRSIPLELQIAVELHYWEGLSTSEIAVVLDIPQGTVKSRLRRARSQLRGALETLADSPQVLESTIETLEAWAARVEKADVS